MAGALSGLRVLDMATLFAGPLAATMLGDFGAEVIKIEHPQRRPGRAATARSKDGVGLWWKMLGRNKRTITLYLGYARGRRRSSGGWSPTPTSSSRTSGPARWSAGASATTSCRAINPRLVLARVTGVRPDRPVRAAGPASARSPRR